MTILELLDLEHDDPAAHERFRRLAVREDVPESVRTVASAWLRLMSAEYDTDEMMAADQALLVAVEAVPADWMDGEDLDARWCIPAEIDGFYEPASWHVPAGLQRYRVAAGMVRGERT